MLKTADDMIRDAQQHIDCVDVTAAQKIHAENPGAVIIDVRDADSVANSKLSDSVNISRGLLEMKILKTCPEAETVILTHCGGGGRASLAAQTLKNMGYQKVYAITAPYDDIKKAFG
jgi:phage shock protein E